MDFQEWMLLLPALVTVLALVMAALVPRFIRHQERAAVAVPDTSRAMAR
jgi:hypothetical protein